MTRPKQCRWWGSQGLAWILVLATFLGGCRLFEESEPDPIWIERELPAASDNVVWQVIVKSLGQKGYPLGAGLDPDRMVAVTGWRRSMAPFKGKGYQLRATVEIVPLADARYTVRVRVQRQNNETIVNPADPRYAEWEWEPDDETEARILMQHFRTYLDTELDLGSGARE